MRLNVFLLCFSFLVSSLASVIRDDDEGDCSLENVENMNWNLDEVIEDVADVNTLIQSEKYDNIASIDEKCTSTKCYFQVKLDMKEKSIQIFPSEHLKDIDGDQYDILTDTFQYQETYKLFCSNEKSSTLIINANIKDTNNNKPEFEDEKYEYKVPMPMPANIDLKQFEVKGREIRVNDLDFSNTKVTFSSSDADKYGIKISHQIVSYDEENKAYPYSFPIKFAEFTSLTKDQTFNLVVEDSGEPPKTSKVPVTIIIDQENSEPNEPTFTAPSYKYEYSVQSGQINPMNESPTLDSSESDVTCEINGDDGVYFDTPKVEDGKVQLSLKKKLPTTELSMNVILSCYYKDLTTRKGYTDIILIYNTSPVTFTQKVYAANLIIENSVQSVEMVENVVLQPQVDDLTLVIEDSTYNNYFVMKLDGSKEFWILNQEENLDKNLLQNMNLNIFISLQNDEKTVLDSAVIVLNLPNGKNGVKFEKPFYEGNYKIDTDGKVDFSIDSSIKLNSNDLTLTESTLSNEDCDINKYFTVETKDNEFTLTKTDQILPSEIMEKGVLALTLKVKITIGKISQEVETTILLHLIDEKTSDKNSFTSPEYNAKLIIENNKQKIDMSDDYVKLTNPADDVDVKIENQKYESYFELEEIKEDGYWNLKLVKKLDEKLLQDMSINLVITARDGKQNILDSSVIAVYLPNVENGVKFEKPYYEGYYKIDTDGKVDFSIDSSIKLNSNDLTLTDTTLSNGDYDISKYFIVEMKDNEFTLTETDQILPSEIMGKGVLALTLQVEITIGKISQDVETTILLHLIDKRTSDTNSFTSTEYTAKLIIENNEQKIDMSDDHVELTNPADTEVDVKIENQKYESYFQLVEKNGYWNLQLQKELDEELLQDISINLVITVQDDKQNILDSSVIAIYLPNVENGVKFEKPYFEGDYKIDENGKVEFSIESSIKLNSYDLKIEKTTLTNSDEDFSQYFTVEKGQNEFKLTETDKNLPSEIMKKGVLPLTLSVEITVGKITQEVETTVLLHLIDGNADVSDDCDCSYTAWIVVTVLLCLSIAAYVGGTLFYYFKKIK